MAQNQPDRYSRLGPTPRNLDFETKRMPVYIYDCSRTNADLKSHYLNVYESLAAMRGNLG